MSTETLYNLEDNLLLFFTGYSRSASDILKEQDDKSKQNDNDMMRQPALREGARLPEPGRAGVGRPATSSAELMNVHWEHKKQRSGGMSNPQIDDWYELGDGERRARRQADRRRRRRLPDVLRRGQDPAAPRHDGRGLDAKCGSGSTSRGRKLLSHRDVPAPIAVLAGGLATRMRPLTETVPKSMLEVAGEPFIAHQLRLFKRQGLDRVVLCLGHLGGAVRDFVGDGSAFGLSVSHRLTARSSSGPRALSRMWHRCWARSSGLSTATPI